MEHSAKLHNRSQNIQGGESFGTPCPVLLSVDYIRLRRLALSYYVNALKADYLRLKLLVFLFSLNQFISPPSENKKGGAGNRDDFPAPCLIYYTPCVLVLPPGRVLVVMTSTSSKRSTSASSASYFSFCMVIHLHSIWMQCKPLSLHSSCTARRLR